MIEINFFEQKKRNYSPFLLVAIFMIGLVLIGTYIVIFNTNLVNEYDQNMAQIEQQQPRVIELRQTQNFADRVQELTDQLETLETHQYPTPFLYETISDVLPESDAFYLLNYSFSTNGAVQLSVQLDGFAQIAELDRALTDLDFVTQVDLDVANLVNEGDRHYVVNIRVAIDRDQLSEVTAND